MRKVLGVIAGVALLGGGAVMGFVGWSGRKVIERMEQQTADLEKALPAVKVVDKKIERGLFQATRTFTLRIGCMPQPVFGAPKPQEPIELRWKDVIHYGPFPGGGLGFASIDSELVSPPNWKERIDKLTGSRPLIAVHTAVSLGGEVQSDFSVPALHWVDDTEGGIDTSAIAAHFTSKASDTPESGGTYHGEMRPFELIARANDGTSLTIKLGAIESDTQVAPRKDKSLLFVPAKVTSKGQSLTFIGTAAKDLNIPPVNAEFTDLQVTLESKLDNGLYSSTSSSKAKGKINKVDVDAVELAVSMRRIHAATYQKLIDSMLGTVFSCDPKVQAVPPTALFDTMQQEFASLLVYNPEYAVDTMAVQVAGKRAELSYSVGTQGVTADDVKQPVIGVLATKGFARVSAKVDTALIARGLEQLGALDANAVAAAGVPPAEQVKAMVATMTDTAVQMGYVVRDGDAIKATASYESGAVLLNGKPMDLPDLSGLGK